MQKDFKQQALPKPVPIEEEVKGTPDHGLWDFFKDEKLLQKPVEEHAHGTHLYHWLMTSADVNIGREWTMGELRNRDFDVLHRLWWVCAKERNRLATARIELVRMTAGTGEAEIKARDKTVQKTMKAILDTLAERHTAYSEAYELAKNDPTIDLTRTDGPQLNQAPAYVRIGSFGQ
jgi:large subunit ribosomal protein L47